MLGVLWVAALGAEPQCPLSGTQSCIMRIDGHFGKVFIEHHSGMAPSHRFPYRKSDAPTMCRKSFYDAVDHCAWNSDFRLTIVEPEEFRSSVALRDFVFTPWADMQHIDQTHPIHGKVLDVVLPLTGDGCSRRDWVGSGVDEQIMLVDPLGSCWSRAKVDAVIASGQRPAAMIVSGVDTSLGMIALAGSSAGIEDVPIQMGEGALNHMAQEALAKGKTLRGKIELLCPTGEETFAQPGFTDGCPDWKLRGICNNASEPEDRLCSKCPLQLKRGADKVCLHRARLFPSKTANFFQATRRIPSDVDVVYLDLPPWAGCHKQDYAGLVGKVIALPWRGCMHTPSAALNAMRIAEQEGVVGIIFLYFVVTFPRDPLPIGPSHLHGIPIHVVAGTEATVVSDIFLAEGTRDGMHVSLPWEFVDEDVAPDAVVQVPPPPASRVEVQKEPTQLRATPRVVISIVVIIAAAAAIVTKFVGNSGLQLAREDGVAGVPLSVASMLLSVSLLVVATAIAFGLSAQAAQQATAEASADGEAAAELIYAHAVRNVDRLSAQFREQAVGQVHGLLDRLLGQGQQQASGILNVMSMWDGTWDDFKAKYHESLGLLYAGTGWFTSVKTTQHFYAGGTWMTDYTSPGAERALREADDGRVSGIAQTELDRLTMSWRQMFPRWGSDELDESPAMRIGGDLLDPLEALRSLTEEYSWQICTRGIPLSLLQDFHMPWISIAVVAAMRDPKTRSVRGAVVNALELKMINHELRHVTSGKQQLENMTILLYDTETVEIMAGTHYYRDAEMSQTIDHYYTYNLFTAHYRVRTLAESFDIVDAALYTYLQENPVPESGELSVELDQRDYYRHRDLHDLHVVAGDGRAIDRSDAAHVLAMHGQCGACVEEDPTYLQVLRFDGVNTLYVDLNLTTDIPYVAAKRVGNGSDPWTSNDHVYRFARPIPGTDLHCIYRNTTFNSFGTYCSMRGLADVYLAPMVTVSVRVKPDEDVGPTDVNQKLFEQTTNGNSQFTIYASGALVMSLAQGFCDIPGAGIPGGVWTTITARRVSSSRTCEVWLNGTLHRSSFLVNAPLPPDQPEPFGIGRGFRGKLQSVRIYKFLADPEALTHTRFVRKVPSRRWFVDIGKYARPGFEWRVSVRIPRDDVMRDVDANNRHLMADLRQRTANTQAKLDRDMAETVLVTAMVVLVSVLVFLVFNDLLTRPFANISSVMCDAAVMRIEEIPEQASPIAELNAMQAAMGLMLANLKEYRSFMPQFITEALNDDGSDTEASVSAKSGSTKKSTSTGASDSSIVSGSGSRGIYKAIKTKSFTAAAGMQAFLAVQLTTKRISLAALNVVDFMCKDKSKAALDIHGQLLTFLLGCAAGLHGVVTSFSGDRFVVSFNASRMCTDHRTAAGMLGCQFAEHGKEMGLSTSGGLVSGDAKVGSMGCISMRTFSVLSPLVPLANALERYSRNITAALVCDASINRECRTVASRHAGLFRLAKYQDKPMQVFEVLRSIGGGKVDEWMYELEASAARDPYTQWNECVHAITTGDWDTVEKTQKHLTGDSLLSRVMRRAAERNEYEATDYTPYF